MKVLIACEFSGRVRDAFLARGHDAHSCDLEPTEHPGPHYQGDVRDILYAGWDLLIGHPECTYLCNSGSKHLYQGGRLVNGRDENRWINMYAAAEFFLELWRSPISRICIENPIMHEYAKEHIGVRQTQVVQPWMFGHGVTKATCLWLKNLPALRPTNVVDGRHPEVHYESPGPNRRKNRSRTYEGIAAAMAEQWG